MRNVTEIISTKRSGHHAFIRWLCGNSRRPLVFFNNVVPCVPPRLRRLEYVKFDGPLPKTAAAKKSELMGGAHDIILNFEGKLPQNVDRLNDEFIVPKTSGRLRRIAFLRDPINMLSSLAARTRGNAFKDKFNFFYQLLAFEEIMHRLDGKRNEWAHRVVLFSAWQKNESYRSELATYFELEDTTLPTKVADFGGGSSFSGMDFDPRTQADSLFSRWKSAENHPLLLACFADETAAKAIDRYFLMFGELEHISPGVAQELARSASKSSQARALARDFLRPLRIARREITRMEHAQHSAIRAAWLIAVQARITFGCLR